MFALGLCVPLLQAAWGHTPYDAAVRQGHTEVAQILQQAA